MRAEAKEMKSPSLAMRDLPYMHPIVDLAHIKENGKFLTDEQIATAKKELADAKEGTIFKTFSDEACKTLNVSRTCQIIYDRVLGEGTYGQVRLAQNADDSKLHVVKIQRELPSDEHKILTKIGKTTKPIISYDEKLGEPVKYGILMEFVSGVNLKNFVKSKANSDILFPAIRWLDIAIQILQKVKDLHDMGILHCDLKLDNFMYDPATHQVVPIDFGFSLEMTEGKATALPMGTGTYMPPEIADEYDKEDEKDINLCEYSEKTEIYSLGVVLKELFGVDPIVEDIDGAEVSLTNKTPFANHRAIKSFLTQMTAQNPDRRGTLSDALHFFHRIREEMIPINVIYVGVADVKDFAQDKKAFTRMLKKFDEVLLVDSEEKLSPKKCLEIRRECENSGINLWNKLAVALPMIDVMKNLPAYFEEKELKSHAKAMRHFLHCEIPRTVVESKLIKNEKEELNVVIKPEDWETLSIILNKEIIRLQEKIDRIGTSETRDINYTRNLTERIKAIKSELIKFAELYFREKLTYHVVASDLEILQNKMISPRQEMAKLSSTSSVVLFKPTKSKRAIEELKTALTPKSPSRGKS